MRPVPIIYVTDMDQSLAWYRAVLAGADVVSTSPWWSELSIEGAALALHSAETVSSGGRVGLAFEADGTLEHLIERLAALGIETEGGVTAQPFGRSLMLVDPDGLHIQVNEHDPEQYPGS